MNENCESCGVSVDTRTQAHYVHVKGWVKGGRRGNALVLTPKRDGLTRCSTCMDKNKQIPGQEELF